MPREKINLHTKHAYSMSEAITAVARRNKYSDAKLRQLHDVFMLALHHIPPQLKELCSYRLLSRERCISINLMNSLLYRTPAYSDSGASPKYDCYLILSSAAKEVFKQFEEKNIFTFKYFDCVNLAFSFDEVLSLTEKEWHYFSDGCRLAGDARRSRNWDSNIEIGEID